jgi:hypothetical protein
MKRRLSAVSPFRYSCFEVIEEAATTTSAVGTKRQFARCKAMSGIRSKADFPVARPDFSV